MYLDLERSIDIINSDGTNDERQTDFGSTNSDSQMSRGDRRTKKTSGSRYKLSREGMKRFLIDQVAKNGHLQFEYLHEVKNLCQFFPNQSIMKFSGLQ